MNAVIAWWPFIVIGALVLGGMALCERTRGGKRILTEIDRVFFGGAR